MFLSSLYFTLLAEHKIWQTTETYSPQTFSVTAAVVAPAVVAPAVVICLNSLIPPQGETSKLPCQTCHVESSTATKAFHIIFTSSQTGKFIVVSKI